MIPLWIGSRRLYTLLAKNIIVIFMQHLHFKVQVDLLLAHLCIILSQMTTKKPKQKKPPRVVYVTDSEDEDEVMEDAYETPQPWYNFV